VALPLAAHAEGSLEVTSTVTPEALEKAGKVDINIRLTNKAGYMLEDVTLIARGINETLGNYEAGVKKVYNITNFRVEENEIGDAVTFTFVWHENGEPQSMEHRIPIARKTATPDMKAERTLSSNSGSAGDVITITYAVQNTGEVDLANVTIADPALPSPITIGTIAVGQVKRVSKDITLSENITSAPVITADGGGTPLTVNLDPAQITLTNAKLDLQVSAGEPAATGTPVTIVVKNEGNVDFKSVALIDESGTALTTAFPLAQSDTKTITVDIPVEQARTLTVTATATYGEGSGTPLIVTALPVELTPYISPKDIVVTLLAKPIKQQFDEPAEVTFAIRIDNDSPITLYDFELTEAQDGRLLTLGTVEQGAQTVNVKVMVTETREVSFSAVFRDENGTAYSAAATPVTITIAGPAPTEEPQNDDSGASWLKWLLLIIIILLLAAAASLVYVLAQSRRRREQEREAEELDRLLAARQERRRQDTLRSKKVRDEDLEEAVISQITGRTEKPRVPVRPRAGDLTIGEPPAPRAQRPSIPQDRPGADADDLFEDEFK
jgi:uncharacterized repeat protein (TIGR01451 family)